MKRDLELIRYLLLTLEESSSLDSIDSSDLVNDYYDGQAISYHVHLLIDCNFIIAEDITCIGDDYSQFQILRLTSNGHDYLDHIRDNKIWTATKEKLGSLLTSASLQVVSATALEVIKLQIGILLRTQ